MTKLIKVTNNICNRQILPSHPIMCGLSEFYKMSACFSVFSSSSSHFLIWKKKKSCLASMSSTCYQLTQQWSWTAAGTFNYLFLQLIPGGSSTSVGGLCSAACGAFMCRACRQMQGTHTGSYNVGTCFLFFSFSWSPITESITEICKWNTYLHLLQIWHFHHPRGLRLMCACQESRFLHVCYLSHCC